MLIIDHFWDHVLVKSQHDCWPWLRRTNTGGYGLISGHPPDRKEVKAHRVALSLDTGVPLPELGPVAHRCGNPSCCNPSHLRECTHTDNIADTKAMMRTTQGERNPMAKLTEKEAKAIYCDRRAGCLIAGDFGVSVSTVSLIRRKKTWKHIHGHSFTPCAEGRIHTDMNVLDTVMVRVIRSDRSPTAVLALELGVSPGAVHLARRGSTWAWFEPENIKPMAYYAKRTDVRNGRAKVSDDEVRAIRVDPRNASVIAKEYGIHRNSVFNIKNKTTWAHVK